MREDPSYDEARHGQVRAAVERHREIHPSEYRFLSFDGEGDGTGKDSRYFLLQDSSGRTLRKDDIGIRDALPFLCARELDGKKTINVWYSAGYDWNMMLRDEDPEILGRLLNGERVFFDDYAVKIVPRKSLTITRNGHCYRHYDTFSYSATSFVDALAAWGLHPINPDKTAADDGCLICRGKKARSDFPPDFQIEEYNLLEVKMHEKLMDRVKESVVNAGLLRPRMGWHGPGAIANVLMKECGAREAARGDFTWDVAREDGHSSTETSRILSDVGKFPNLPASNVFRQMEQHRSRCDHLRRSAYFGGRIEAPMRGTFGPVYNYDLISAYPAAMLEMPSLAISKFETREKLTEEELNCHKFGLVEVEWKSEVDNPLGVLPFRRDGDDPDSSRNGIIFPNFRVGGDDYLRGVYHLVEVQEALRKTDADGASLADVRLGKAWIITDAKDYPFRKLEEKMDLRARLKREGNPGHKSLKLGLNSCFGKQAQKFGAYEFWSIYELMYAGFITARTRAQLLRYADPHETIMLTTDGIHSRVPLRCPPGDKVGEWELTKYESGDFVLPGIYKVGEEVKRRGYPRFDFDAAYARILKEGSFSFADRRFVGVRQSLAQPNAYPKAGFYDGQEREVDWTEGNSKREPSTWEDGRSLPRNPSRQGKSLAAARFDDSDEEDPRVDEDEKDSTIDTYLS